MGVPAPWLSLSHRGRRGCSRPGGLPRVSGCAPRLRPMRRNLLANPFNCNCQLAWLGDWLRKRKIVTGNPRCQNPDFLRQIPLQDVAFPDFRCEEGNSQPPAPAPSPVPCQPPAPHSQLGSPCPSVSSPNDTPELGRERACREKKTFLKKN